MKLTDREGLRCWEGWREGATVHVTTATGGGKPRESRKSFADDAAAEKDLQTKLRARFREGYVFRADESAGDG